MADARLSIGVSADAKQASATFKDLAADIKNVGKESVGVTDGVARVAAALDKLKSAPDTPIALARATAKAKVEIADLRAELEKTPASAEKMKAISAALKQADEAIEGTIKRAGKLAESQEEVKQKMGLTAKGAEALGGSLGSLTGVMGKMADSSSAVAQGVAKVGFAVVAAGQAFKLGYETGEKFRQGLQAIGVQVPDLSDKMAKLVVNIEGMVRGYKEAELVESAAMNRARQIVALREAQAASERALAEAQAAAGVEWKNADDDRQKTIDKLNAIEQALARAGKSEAEYAAVIKANAPIISEEAKAAEAKGIALEKVAPRMAAAAAAAAGYAKAAADAKKAQDDFAAANTKVVDVLDRMIPAMKGIVFSYGETEASALRLAESQRVSLSDLEKMVSAEAGRAVAAGQSRDAYDLLIAAIDRLQAKGVDTTKQIDAEIEARKRLAQAVKENEAADAAAFAEKQKRWAAEDAAANRTFKAPDDFKRIQDAAFGAAVAAGELGTNLDNVAAAVVATGGTMVVGAPIWIQIAQATDEATASLLRYMEATRALNEQQSAALEVTRGWTDYVIALKDSYEAGTTSLYNYITMLAQFKTQLLQMFGAVSGEAKDALNGMIALIEKLIQTAGASGGKYDPSMAGQLEKMFRDAKGGE